MYIIIYVIYGHNKLQNLFNMKKEDISFIIRLQKYEGVDASTNSDEVLFQILKVDDILFTRGCGKIYKSTNGLEFRSVYTPEVNALYSNRIYLWGTDISVDNKESVDTLESWTIEKLLAAFKEFGEYYGLKMCNDLYNESHIYTFMKQ